MQYGAIYVIGDALTIGGVGDSPSWILYQNRLPDCTVLQGGDISRLHDNMTNILYDAATGTTTVELTLPTADIVNCFATAGINWVSSEGSCKFYCWESGAYVLKAEVLGRDDGSPTMRVFDPVTTDTVKFEFIATNQMFVGEAAFGEALQMPSCPAVGLQPGEWSDNDTVSMSQTMGLNFGASTVNKRGSTQVMQFNYVTPEFMDGQIGNFRRAAKGQPVWVGWNQKDRLSSVIYGHWEMQPPKFDSSFYTSLNLTVNGVV